MKLMLGGLWESNVGPRGSADEKLKVQKMVQRLKTIWTDDQLTW